MQDAEVAHIAKKNGKTVAQTLLRWGLQHGTSVIPKSSNPKHSQVGPCCMLCSQIAHDDPAQDAIRI